MAYPDLPVEESDVRAIIDTSIADISAYILTADTVVQNNLMGKDLAQTELFEIERWLSAHYVAMQDPSLTSDTIGSAKQDFEKPQTGMGLEATRWGQQAISLDSSGTLGSLGKRKPKPIVESIPA